MYCNQDVIDKNHMREENMMYNIRYENEEKVKIKNPGPKKGKMRWKEGGI